MVFDARGEAHPIRYKYPGTLGRPLMAKKERVAKRVKDKWKAKGWYTIHAPAMFNRAVLGESPAESDSHLMGRLAEVTVQDLTGDFSKAHIKVQFQVVGIKDSNASTSYVGHDMSADYVRRLTRRKRSRIDGTFDVKTRDGAIVRVKPMAITDRRIQGSKQTAIRKIMHQVLYKKASSMLTPDFVKTMIIGDLAKDIADACKAIQPIFRVELRRSELLKMSEVVVEEEPIQAPQEEEIREEAPAIESEAPEAEGAEEPKAGDEEEVAVEIEEEE